MITRSGGSMAYWFFFFFQAEDGIRDVAVTGVQTCALPIYFRLWSPAARGPQRRAPRSEIAPVSRSAAGSRSEERRVGKECRYRGWPDQYKKKKKWRELLAAQDAIVTCRYGTLY